MERIPHYVKPNETTRMPRRHVFVDVEANEQESPLFREQTWRLAVARFWSAEKGRKEHESEDTYTDPAELWSAVDAFTKPKTRTVLWTHNLGYDARVGASFTHLPKLGYRLVAHNLNNRGTWFTWRRGTHTLMCVDSASVFPVALKQVGEYFGIGKPDLPRWEDNHDAWVARCKADVAILSRAVRSYLEWLEREDLGNWQCTGSGQSYAAYRHRFLAERLLVHDDADALAAERRAMWTGRCEAYWHGQIRYQVVHEWDFNLAYARIARDTRVPTRLIRELPASDALLQYVSHPALAILAEVEVSTTVPCVPTSVDGRIAWPVGDFTTTLWGPEIKLALESGARITFVRAWLYKTTYALREWATWIIDRLEAPDSEVPAWQKVILKHWARALIGRFAMSYTAWDQWGELPVSRLTRGILYDPKTQEVGELMQIGHDVFRKSGVEEWSQSMPAITGFVMSVCRVRLASVSAACPDRSILYCDTDSILATDQFHDAIKTVADLHPEWGLRLKRSWHGFGIWGPRQIVTGEQIRISGLPKRARQTNRNVFVGEVWESVDVATKQGRFDRVRIVAREWTVKGVDHRRRSVGVGWTVPITVGADTCRTSPTPSADHSSSLDSSHSPPSRARPGVAGRAAAGSARRASSSSDYSQPSPSARRSPNDRPARRTRS